MTRPRRMQAWACGFCGSLYRLAGDAAACCQCHTKGCPNRPAFTGLHSFCKECRARHELTDAARNLEHAEMRLDTAKQAVASFDRRKKR